MTNSSTPSGEPTQTPPVTGLGRLVKSSAAWVSLFAIVGVIIMNVVGRISGERALDFIQWIVLANIGKTALEDAIVKLRHGSATGEEMLSYAARILALSPGKSDSSTDEQ